MEGVFNPGTKAENQEGPANSRSDDLFQHSQGAIGSLRLRWLLGSLRLGIRVAEAEAEVEAEAPGSGTF